MPWRKLRFLRDLRMVWYHLLRLFALVAADPVLDLEKRKGLL